MGSHMEQFASGWNQHYYGKGDVSVYKLQRDGNAAHTQRGTPGDHRSRVESPTGP